MTHPYNQTPNTPEHAVQIARSLVGRGVYRLGKGSKTSGPDDGYDCCSFAVEKCYNLDGHIPGFNRGAHATVVDYINYNSALEDAETKMELFIPVFSKIDGEVQGVDVPQPGDLLCYPTLNLMVDGKMRKWIGHGAIVVGVPAEWEWGRSRWRELSLIQCAGPELRKPAILPCTGAHWDLHDSQWPKPGHRSKLIRVRQP